MAPDQSVGIGRRRRRIALWSVVIVVTLLLAGALTIATAPRWGADRLEAELERRVGQRLDAEVEIAELEASWAGAELSGVSVVMDGLEVEVDRVSVRVDRRALWSARAEVLEVEAVGGRLVGERSGVEAFVRQLAELGGEPDQDDRSWWRRRIRLTPDALELRALTFDLRDGSRHVTGDLAATAQPKHERVELRMSSVLAELGLGRPLRAASLRTTLERREGAFRFPLELDIAGGATRVDQNIAVSGVHGRVGVLDRAASEVEVDLAGGFAEADPEEAGSAGGGAGAGAGAEPELWSIRGQFARDLSEGRVEVEMEAFELGRVPQVLASLPLVESEAATVGGALELDFGEGKVTLDGRLALAGLHVSHPLLAREVIRDVGFEVELDAQVDPAARRLTLDRLALARGGVELRARGELIHAVEREQRRYTLALEVPRIDCQSVLDAIPRELVPGLQGFEIDGAFEAQLALDADFANLDALELDGAIGIEGCVVRKAPRRATAAHLSGAFVHRVTMRDGRTRRIPLYSGSSSYTPLDGISRYMTEAVLTTEDGSFRRHDGFNRTSLETALRRNLQSGKVRIGASTITMQMVKNVLLSHERTLSRKLQELFLTWWVEEALSKQRIMELYLNVIEFGPGIYGVSNASRHYFGKHPGDLGSLEAAFLTAMLPSPVRRHVHYCNGTLSERFDKKVHWVHDLMRDRSRITAEEHAAYEAQGLVFDLLERGDPDVCLAEINTIMAGKHTQRALSGLLGDDDGDPGFGDGRGHPPSRSWGVRPPLPVIVEGLGGAEGEGIRLEPSEPADQPGWRVPSEPIDDDPANSDAPGHPAMDE